MPENEEPPAKLVGYFLFSGGQFCCRLFANLACGCLRRGLYVVPPEASAPCSGSPPGRRGHAMPRPSGSLQRFAALARQGIRTACLPRGNGEPYNGTLSLLAQIKKNPSRLKQRLGHRISYSVSLRLRYNQRGSLPPAVRSATPLSFSDLRLLSRSQPQIVHWTALLSSKFSQIRLVHWQYLLALRGRRGAFFVASSLFR